MDVAMMLILTHIIYLILGVMGIIGLVNLRKKLEEINKSL